VAVSLMDFWGRAIRFAVAVDSVRAMRKLEACAGNDYVVGGRSVEPGGNFWFRAIAFPAISGNSVTYREARRLQRRWSCSPGDNAALAV